MVFGMLVASFFDFLLHVWYFFDFLKKIDIN
ncbi:Hypothetical Protein SLY_0845 [Strawberry lethal yellows phytoplasma (CPA) str. NZSb11]|uniref:Uncharacterized protein n=1 Tax=Strawberry lethal yellows phytoplasma (CPA) str. NZSb11 TaxID=980422 RepID=R4RN28_PHYAS|nr:Hypothetical Protein SLY_0845 [Strawberry lethal yellows phytoplasma (CPA) str. NZSb11]